MTGACDTAAGVAVGAAAAASFATFAAEKASDFAPVSEQRPENGGNDVAMGAACSTGLRGACRGGRRGGGRSRAEAAPRPAPAASSPPPVDVAEAGGSDGAPRVRGTAGGCAAVVPLRDGDVGESVFRLLAAAEESRAASPTSASPAALSLSWIRLPWRANCTAALKTEVPLMYSSMGRRVPSRAPLVSSLEGSTEDDSELESIGTGEIQSPGGAEEVSSTVVFGALLLRREVFCDFRLASNLQSRLLADLPIQLGHFKPDLRSTKSPRMLPHTTQNVQLESSAALVACGALTCVAAFIVASAPQKNPRGKREKK